MDESAAREAEEPKHRRTTFVTVTVEEVRFCMFTMVVAARMVMDDREDKRTGVLNWFDRQEAREVRGVREVAVIDRRERAEQDILGVYRLVDRLSTQSVEVVRCIPRAKNTSCGTRI